MGSPALLNNMEVKVTNLREKLMALYFGPDVMENVAKITRNAVQNWYKKLPEDWFDNPQPFPDGTPRHEGKRTFMKPLRDSWTYALTENGFDLDFFFQRKNDEVGPWGLRLQQYGGIITPKKKRALTIPVTAEARGLTVRAFQEKTGKNLFSVKTKNAKDPSHIGTLVWEDPTGDLHAAYVLRSRSNVPPLRERRGHDAIPSAEEIGGWASQAYVEYLNFLGTK